MELNSIPIIFILFIHFLTCSYSEAQGSHIYVAKLSNPPAAISYVLELQPRITLPSYELTLTDPSCNYSISKLGLPELELSS